MSMDRCVECERQVDTDADTYCYTNDVCTCEQCRDKQVERSSSGQTE